MEMPRRPSEFAQTQRRNAMQCGTNQRKKGNESVPKKSSTRGFLRKCQPPACQGSSKDRREKSAVLGQEEGRQRAEKRVIANATKRRSKGKKCILPHHVEAKAMAPGRPEHLPLTWFQGFRALVLEKVLIE